MALCEPGLTVPEQRHDRKLQIQPRNIFGHVVPNPVLKSGTNKWATARVFITDMCALIRVNTALPYDDTMIAALTCSKQTEYHVITAVSGWAILDK